MDEPTDTDRSSVVSSQRLLEQARAGDADALDRLVSRYLPRLRRWAHRRLPVTARRITDTDDLVQNTLIKTLRNLPGFDASAEGGLQHYLRRSIANGVLDEMRKARRQPGQSPVTSSWADETASPLDQVVGRERMGRYEAALATLTAEERDAVIARFEFGFTHQELAAALGKSTPDAARKLCAKATARVVAAMARLDAGGTSCRDGQDCTPDVSSRRRP